MSGIVSYAIRTRFYYPPRTTYARTKRKYNRTFIDTGCDARLIENFDIHRPEKKVGCRPELPLIRYSACTRFFFFSRRHVPDNEASNYRNILRNDNAPNSSKLALGMITTKEREREKKNLTSN